MLTTKPNYQSIQQQSLLRGQSLHVSIDILRSTKAKTTSQKLAFGKMPSVFLNCEKKNPQYLERQQIERLLIFIIYQSEAEAVGTLRPVLHCLRKKGLSWNFGC